MKIKKSSDLEYTLLHFGVILLPKAKQRTANICFSGLEKNVNSSYEGVIDAEGLGHHFSNGIGHSLYLRGGTLGTSMSPTRLRL